MGLSGELAVRRFDMLYDAGHALNPLVDIGQAEGAFCLGQGYWTQEETIYTKDGHMTTDSTWEYKPTMNNQIPTEFNVEFMCGKGFPQGVKKSKATGEPPFLSSRSIFGAIKEAIRASRVERGLSPVFELHQPASVDRIQMACEVSKEHLTSSLG